MYGQSNFSELYIIVINNEFKDTRLCVCFSNFDAKIYNLIPDIPYCNNLGLHFESSLELEAEYFSSMYAMNCPDDGGSTQL
jgi:hypothetical protein